MAKRSEGDSCCLTLPLRLEKWQEDRLAKRLEIARQIYNSLVSVGLKKIQKKEYRIMCTFSEIKEWNF